MLHIQDHQRLWNFLPVFSNVMGSFLSAMNGMSPQLFWDAEGKKKTPIRIASVFLSCIFALGAYSSYLQQDRLATKDDLKTETQSIAKAIIAEIKTDTNSKEPETFETDFTVPIVVNISSGLPLSPSDSSKQWEWPPNFLSEESKESSRQQAFAGVAHTGLRTLDTQNHILHFKPLVDNPKAEQVLCST